MIRRALPLLLPCLLLAACDAAGVRSTSAPADAAPTAIGAVQGAGMQSPLLGRVVSIEGIVTADAAAARGGVFVQSAPRGGDGDDATSDGIFVALDAAGLPRPGVAQRIGVTGTVVELPGTGGASVTALQATRVVPLGPAALPDAHALAVVPAPEAAERLEGMRVEIRALTFSEAFDARRDHTVASIGGRLFQPTELARPGPAAQAVAADNRRRSLRVKGWAPFDAGLRSSADGDRASARAGLALRQARGVLEPGDAEPILWLQSHATVEPSSRPGSAPSVGATASGDKVAAVGAAAQAALVSVAAINLENYFNGDGRGAGYPTPRGAKDPAAQARQLVKLVHVIRSLQPSVAALMEVENDGYGVDSSLAQLVAALNAGNADAAPSRWRLVDAGRLGGGRGPGTDAIRVAMIYNADVVVPAGAPATLVDGPFATRSRAPLAQAFRPRGGGLSVVVVANHFKSKGCGNATGADADRGDGQACWNATRVDSSRRLHAWLETDPTRSRSDLAVILGDLNSYRMEDPVVALTDAGWRDAFEVARRPARGAELADTQPYSYVYDGQAGRLDHGLLSPALARRLTGAAEWHINADEPNALGYANAAANASPNPWRSSDHDPLLLGFDLRP